MLRGRCACAISALPTSSSRPPLFSNSHSTSPFCPRQLCALGGQHFLFAFFLATSHSPLATFFTASRLAAATLPLSTLVQSPLPIPLQSTHAHLSHSRPPITPAVATHANLVLPNSFPCNTCEKKSCGRPADILECGGSPPLLRLTEWRPINRLAKVDYVAKAGASSRTPKGTPALGLRPTPFPSILDVPHYEAHLFGSQRDYRRRARCT